MREDRGLERTARPSVLDRLIDLHRREPSDPPMSREASVAAYRSSVLRDVEWLLNTRRTTVPIPDAMSEVADSVFAYGLPDVTSLGADQAETRLLLIRQIERTLKTFEPRLTDVRVSIGSAPEVERRVHFTVEGLLKMEPNPERVVFDTVMELSRGDFSVTALT